MSAVLAPRRFRALVMLIALVVLALSGCSHGSGHKAAPVPAPVLHAQATRWIDGMQLELRQSGGGDKLVWPSVSYQTNAYIVPFVMVQLCETNSKGGECSHAIGKPQIVKAAALVTSCASFRIGDIFKQGEACILQGHGYDVIPGRWYVTQVAYVKDGQAMPTIYGNPYQAK